MRLLVVCTANMCRSPMAEALINAEFERVGSSDAEASVSSAGVRARPGSPASDGSVHQMKRRGIDLSGHVSREASTDLVDSADLVLTMEMAHVVDLVTDPSAGPDRLARTFTLREFVERAEAVGPRGDAPLEDYLHSVGEGRRARDLVSLTDVDVADPIGRSDRHYRRCANELDDLARRLVGLLGGT